MTLIHLTQGERRSRCPSIFSSRTGGGSRGRGGDGGVWYLAHRVTPTAKRLNCQDRPELAAVKVAAVALLQPRFLGFFLVATSWFLKRNEKKLTGKHTRTQIIRLVEQ